MDSSYGYYILFKKVFTLISKLCNKLVEFFPIHHTGIQAIVVDMDSKQAEGIYNQLIIGYKLIIN